MCPYKMHSKSGVYDRRGNVMVKTAEVETAVFVCRFISNNIAVKYVLSFQVS